MPPIPGSGEISFGTLNSALGRGDSETSLASASLGYYETINTASISRPNTTAPYSISEWYGYNSTAIATTAIEISDESAKDAVDACAFSIATPVYHNGDTDFPDIGNFIFTDAEGVNTFNGGENYWKITGNMTIQINSSGEVLNKADC